MEKVDATQAGIRRLSDAELSTVTGGKWGSARVRAGGARVSAGWGGWGWGGPWGWWW